MVSPKKTSDEITALAHATASDDCCNMKAMDQLIQAGLDSGIISVEESKKKMEAFKQQFRP